MCFSRIGVLVTLLLLCHSVNAEHDTHLSLQAPPDNEFVDPVTVFRWVPLDDPDLSTYRLIFARDPGAEEDVVLELPNEEEPGPITSPQIAFNLSGFCGGEDSDPLFWTVAAEDASGAEIVRSQEVFSVFCRAGDPRGFTVISGLVKSNLNQKSLAGARVSVNSATGQGETLSFNNVAVTVFNEEYIVIAATRNNGNPIDEEIVIKVEKAGFGNETAVIETQDKTNSQVNLNFFMTPLNNTFTDVQEGDFAFDAVERLVRAGITKGCGNGTKFCPNSSVTRAQIAVFLERGIRGSDFTPHPTVGNVFLDVPESYLAGGWIELFFSDGITSGCGGMNYCPDLSVTRAQMAVFLLRAIHG